jgi:hypothetical protein
LPNFLVGKKTCLFLLFALALAYSQESLLYDCFTAEAPRNFWKEESYLNSNPYMEKPDVLGRRVHSFAFDDAENASLWELEIPNANRFLSHFHQDYWEDFSDVAPMLDNAVVLFQSAKNLSFSAHFSASRAKGIFFDIAGLLDALFSINAIKINAARSSIAFEYVTFYPNFYWSSLSASSDLFVQANALGRALARKVDGQMQKLEFAGAASKNYAGKAKASYLDAKNLLSEAGFCGRQRKAAKLVLDYFGQKPKIPTTMPPILYSYLNSTIGEGNSSSIYALANAYILLKKAQAEMEAEYDEAYGRAYQLSLQFEKDFSDAQRQELYKLSDLPPLGSSGQVTASTALGGVQETLNFIAPDVSRIKSEVSSSRAIRMGKARGYLADAIFSANQAAESALRGIHTVENVLNAARQYEKLECSLAKNEIEAAKLQMEKQLPAGSQDAKYLAQERILLAEKSMSQADLKATIGSRYAECQKALNAAKEALEILKGGALRPYAKSASKELDSFEKFLAAAEKDGIDVEFEKSWLADARAILAHSNSSLAMEQAASVALALREGIISRLEAKYSGLNSRYARLESIVYSARQADAGYLAQFDSLQAKFISGRLDVASNAGSLLEISKRIDELESQVEKSAPKALSKILSMNARATAIISPPAIGQESEYQIHVYAKNPSLLESSSPVSFSVEADLPIYSADFKSGDALLDAYPSAGKSVLAVPSVGAGQEFHFVFGKREIPAKASATARLCQVATQESAEEKVQLSFFASRDLDELEAGLEAPQRALTAKVQHAGKTYDARVSWASGVPYAQGKIYGVQKGANTAVFLFSVQNPFYISIENRTTQYLGQGRAKVSYIAKAYGQALECSLAEASLLEPYSSVQAFEVLPLGSWKIARKEAVQASASTLLFFSFSPLEKREQAFAVSFIIENASQALSEAIENAYLAAEFFNRTGDAAAIEEAKRLAQLNRTDEALSILAGLQKSQSGLSAQDYSAFLSENSSAGEALASAASAVEKLKAEGLAEQAAKLAAILGELENKAASAASYAQLGKYKSAADSLRAGIAQFRSSLSSLAWKSSLDAAESYAAARKKAKETSQEKLSEIESLVVLSQNQYSSGDHIASFISSSLAFARISDLQRLSEKSEEEAKKSLQAIAGEFALAKKQAELALEGYSSQYSALASQTKAKLPITPTEAQKAIADAQRGMEKALSAKEASSSLSAANSSLQSLLEVSGKIGKAMEWLKGTANSSLEMAKIALLEARQKSSQDDASEISSIEQEVKRAEEMLANSLYADSLSSSSRAQSAASQFIQKKAGEGKFDGKAAALGIASVFFIAAAAYYFWSSQKEGKPKKEVPKAD